MQPKYTTKVSCKDCKKIWFKKTSQIKLWSGKCMSCAKIGSVPWNKGPDGPRIRKKVDVNCQQCKKLINKRVDELKTWSGNCKSCASKLVVRFKQPKPTCKHCNIEIYTKGANCRTCSTKNRSGKRHYKWRGGVTSQSRYERTVFVKFTKPEILKRDDYTCKMCNTRGGNLHIDHIKSWSEFPEIRFEPTNCQTLCMACHYQKTFNRPLTHGIIWGNNLTNYVLQ